MRKQLLAIVGALPVFCAGPCRVRIWHLAADGTRLLRGDTLDTADDLQRGFIEAMLRAGSMTAATL